MDILLIVAFIISLVLAVIMRSTTERKYERFLEQKEQEYRDAIKKEREAAVNSSKAITRGKISEEFIPKIVNLKSKKNCIFINPPYGR